MKHVKRLVAVLVCIVLFRVAAGTYFRARSEPPPPIGDIRTIISAQSTYASHNAGFFDTIECLQAPESCLSEYKGPRFLDPNTNWLRRRRGYICELHPGAPADPASISKANASPSSITDYAYVARPLEQEGFERLVRRLLVLPMTDRKRAFCGDATGRICYAIDAAEMMIVRGLCPDSCTDLR